MKKELPTELAERFDELAESAHAAEQKGDVAQAEKLYLDAWSLLPEPVYDINFYPQVYSRVIVEFYRDSNQHEKAVDWLGKMEMAYAPLNDASTASIAFLRATVLHDGGKLDEAYELFDSLHKKYATRPFKGKDQRWLDFYLARRNK